MPLILLRLWWRGRREPGYREGLAERFGRYQTRAERRILWIHAVSVGEARAAAPLVQALKQALPDHTLLVTCTTAAGRETLRQVYGDSVLAAYLPYDYPGAVQRFLEHFQPRLGVLVETEMWPNLLAACEARGVPVLLANARMSEKSARGYARWARLTGPGFRSLAAVCAQSTADAERLRALGARHIEITGNLKFDVAPDPLQVAAGRAWRRQVDRPVLLLASTREGEEKVLLEAFSKCREVSSITPLVVMVPRHPQRFEELAQWAQSRRSLRALPTATDAVHLGDSMGEMAFYYAACDVAVIGGSIRPFGGQNFIEALGVGAAVVLGPSTYNFAQAAQLALEAGAALQAADAGSAIGEAVRLISDPARRKAMAEAGQRLCEAHRGATERHLAVSRRLLSRE